MCNRWDTYIPNSSKCKKSSWSGWWL
jgi:hypothetical protein